MRILHLDAGRSMRGGQWQVQRLVEGLAKRGVAGTLLAREGSPLFNHAQRSGLDVRPLNWWNVARMAREVELVHAHDARTHTMAAMAGAVLAGAPLVVSRRVAFAVNSPWKYARAARYIAVSQYVENVLLNAGVPPGKISVVYDGVPLLEPSERGDHVYAPASDDPQKGTALALEAARLAGVELALSAQLETDLARAGVFVYVTYSEGLGSGVLLAMAAGVPVIASNVGGLVEIVRHGENGLLVENDAQVIAEAIVRLRADRDLAHRMGEEGRRTVAERFSVDAMVQGTLDVYRQVLAC